MTRATWRSVWVQAADLREGDWFIIPGWEPKRITEIEHVTADTWDVRVTWACTPPPEVVKRLGLNSVRWQADHLVEILVPEQGPDHR